MPTRDRAADAPEPQHATRAQRRKRETRQRLLEAAFKLVSERGIDGVAINEITSEADVGFGSFYNHFESKEAIYASVIEWVFDSYADALDETIGRLSDPAEIMAASVRHTIRRARLEPAWGRFLVREGYSSRIFAKGLGPRMHRDLELGIAQKRFRVGDPFVSFLSIGGLVLAAIVAELETGGAADASTSFQKARGDHLAERVAAAVLEMLGLESGEAKKIATRPLPSWRSSGRKE